MIATRVRRGVVAERTGRRVMERVGSLAVSKSALRMRSMRWTLGVCLGRYER